MGREKTKIGQKKVALLGIACCLVVLTTSPVGTATRVEGLSRRGPVPYKPQWVSVVKKGKIFKYKRKEFSSPRVFQDRIYVGSDAGFLYCLKKKGGRKVWRFKTEGSINSAPAFREEVLFIGDDKGTLYALSADRGKLLWKREIGSEILTEAAIGKGHIFVTTLEGKVAALKPEDGQVVWEREFPNPAPLFQMTIHGNATPVIDEAVLYVGFSDGTLRALQASDGRLLWEKNLGKEKKGFYDIDGAPLVEKDRIYVATFDGTVSALSKNGKVLWSQEIGSGVRLVSEADRLYVSGSDGHLYLLSKKDGSKIWETKIGEGALTAPALYKEIVVVGLSDSTINFLRTTDGKILARRFARKGIFSDPVVIEEGDKGRILYLSNGGRLYSLKFVTP